MTDVTNLSLDDQIKHAQLHKLKRETAAIPAPGWTVDNLAKVFIAVCAIAGAVTAVWLKIPDVLMAKVGAEKALFESEKVLIKREQDLKDKREQIEKLDLESQELTNSIATGRREYQALQDLARALASRISEASQPPQLKEALKPRVFLQFAGAIGRKTVDELRKKYTEAGFTAPAAQRINRGQTNEIRYFSDTADERKAAERIRLLTDKYFKSAGCPIPDLKTKRIVLPEGKSSPVEVWLLHQC